MQRFDSILHVVDPDADNRWAFERACRFAADTQARLTCLLVAEGEAVQEDVDRAALRDGEARLSAMLSEVDTRMPISRRVVLGRLSSEVMREVVRGGYDLVVKAAAGDGGLRERLFGNPDLPLLRQCPCPLWLLKPAGQASYRRILAAVDVVPGDEDAETRAFNQRILECAGALAVAEFAELHLVHAWDAIGSGLLQRWSTGGLPLERASEEFRYVEDTRQRHRQALESQLAAARAALGPAAFDYLAIDTHLPRGPAIEVVPALAADLGADLIVMGTVGRAGISGLLMGNTAETILERCACDVLAIKPPGFAAPGLD